MLVLKRKESQQIRIGDDVVITILEVSGGSVRVGVEAPRTVRVLRTELEHRGGTPAAVESSIPIHHSSSPRQAPLDSALNAELRSRPWQRSSDGASSATSDRTAFRSPKIAQ